MTNFENDLRTKLAGMNADMTESLRNDLRHMLDHIANRIHYAEQRRTHIAIFGTTLIAAGVTLILIWGSWTEKLNIIFLKHSIIALFSCLITLGSIILYIFAKQTNPEYPFKMHTNTWKWFYRDALKDHSQFTYPFKKYFSNRGIDTSLEQENYNDQLQHHKEKICIGLLDPEKHILQDFEQLYVLHLNEKYKNLFLSQLRTVLYSGIKSTIVIVLITAALSGLAQFKAANELGLDPLSDNFHTDSSWKSTPITRNINGYVEVLSSGTINLEIYGPMTKKLKRIKTVDGNGKEIPIEILGTTPNIYRMDGPSKNLLNIFFWTPENKFSRIKALVVE